MAAVGGIRVPLLFEILLPYSYLLDRHKCHGSEHRLNANLFTVHSRVRHGLCTENCGVLPRENCDARPCCTIEDEDLNFPCLVSEDRTSTSPRNLSMDQTLIKGE